jgi:hypothetical protein
MKVDLSKMLKDIRISKPQIPKVINDLTLYSVRQEELIKLKNNKN